MARGSGGAVSAPIDTDDIRDEINGAEFWQMRAWVEDLLPEVERLRAELQEARREGYRLTSLDLESCITEVDRLRGEVAALEAQQCPHKSKTFGQCIVCGWTGRPACSECGEPVPVDSECCSACGAWENALEADA